MPSEKQIEERIENINSILTYLREYGSKSRRDLSNDLNLSWGCISELTKILINKHIILENEGNTIKSKGRTPSSLSLNPNICFLGVDINSRGLSACICNLLGEKITSICEKINFNSNAEFIKSIIDFVNSIICGRDNIFGIGFAMQGIFNPKTNLWNFSSEKRISVDFSKDFHNAFNVPFIVEHDPNCILYGCFNDNSGSKMVVRIDNGIGAAIHKDGEFLKNELLEIGYFVVDKSGKRLHEILSLSQACSISYEKQFAQYISISGEYLGITLGNVCNLFQLDKIYLCGDMVTNYNLLNDAFYTAYKQTAIKSHIAEIISVEVTDAAFGAAKVAIDNFKYYFKENQLC